MSNYWIEYISHKRLPHRLLELYLRINGWNTFKRRGDATSYSSPNGNLRKYIPTNPEYIDYQEGLLFVIEELAEYFKKDIDEFILDVFEKAEVFRFRFDSNLSVKQNIALQEFCDFFLDIKRTITKASNEIDTLSENRKVRVKDLLESCRIGQTQPGSYIIKLFILGIEINTLDFKPEEKRVVKPLMHRYQRFVTEEVYKNYNSLHNLSEDISQMDEDGNLDYFLLKNWGVNPFNS